MVIGGGIVGLTTGLALRKVGFEVTVCERAPEVRSAGAAFGLWRNALRAFEMLGILEAVNAIGKPADMYFHDPTQADGPTRVRCWGPPLPARQSRTPDRFARRRLRP